VECGVLVSLERGRSVRELDEYEELVVKWGESVEGIGRRGVALFGDDGDDNDNNDNSSNYTNLSSQSTSKHAQLVMSVNEVRKLLASALYTSGNTGETTTILLHQCILTETYRRSTFHNNNIFTLPNVKEAIIAPSLINQSNSVDVNFIETVVSKLTSDELLKLLAPYVGERAPRGAKRRLYCLVAKRPMRSEATSEILRRGAKRRILCLVASLLWHSSLRSPLGRSATIILPRRFAPRWSLCSSLVAQRAVIVLTSNSLLHQQQIQAARQP